MSELYRSPTSFTISSKNICLDQHAKDEGLSNRPEQTSRDLSEGELVIVNGLTDHFRNAHKITVENLFQLKNTAEVERVSVNTVTPARIEADIKIQLMLSMMDEEELKNLAEEYAWQERLWRHFRATNGLLRDANYPISKSFHWGIVFLIGIAETTANGCFLATNSPGGLADGILYSAGISAVNILPATFIGMKVFPYINHKEEKLRKRALFGLIASGIGACAFNFVVAHFREGYLQNPEEAWSKTLLDIASNPFSLSLPSIILGLIGISVFAISFHKGYKSSDGYPGYEETDRKYKEKKDAFDSKVMEVLRKVEEIPPKALAFFDSKINALSESSRRFKAVVDQGRAKIEEFKAAVSEINNDTNKFLKRYRENNVAVRTTPVPSYFAEYPERFSAHLKNQKWLDEENVVQIVSGMELHAKNLRASTPEFGRNVIVWAKSIPAELKIKVEEIAQKAKDVAKNRDA